MAEDGNFGRKAGEIASDIGKGISDVFGPVLKWISTDGLKMAGDALKTVTSGLGDMVQSIAKSMSGGKKDNSDVALAPEAAAAVGFGNSAKSPAVQSSGGVAPALSPDATDKSASQQR